MEQRALALFRASKNGGGAARALLDIGCLRALERSSIEAGRAELDEALRMARATGDDDTLVFVSAWYGGMEQRLGDLDRAALLIKESQNAAERAGDERSYLVCETDLATLDAMNGRGRKALESLNAVASKIVGRGDRIGLIDLLRSYAAAHAAIGDPFRAARLEGASEQLRANDVGLPFTPEDVDLMNRCTRSVRALITSEEWERHSDAGRRLSYAEAVAEARDA